MNLHLHLSDLGHVKSDQLNHINQIITNITIKAFIIIINIISDHI